MAHTGQVNAPNVITLGGLWMAEVLHWMPNVAISSH